jgi:hypothetical protein
VEQVILGDVFAFVTAIVGIGCFTGVVVTWIKWRGSRQAKASPDILGRLDQIAEHLSRLDNALDAVAVEVERISEAQRFTSRILSERAGAPGLPDAGRASGSATSR